MLTAIVVMRISIKLNAPFLKKASIILPINTPIKAQKIVFNLIHHLSSDKNTINRITSKLLMKIYVITGRKQMLK